jgi:hypothetical protein
MTTQYSMMRPAARFRRAENGSLAELSFALYEAAERGASLEALAHRLQLTVEFVTERAEAARLCLVKH